MLVLLQYQASTRVGHLDKVLHIFDLLRTKTELQLCTNPEYSSIYYGNFSANEKIQNSITMLRRSSCLIFRSQGVSFCKKRSLFICHMRKTLPLGNHIQVSFFLNRSPVYWYRKQQKNVESRTFNNELIP